MVVELTNDNEKKLQELARLTGRTPSDLVNEAVERLAVEDADEQRRFKEWHQSMLRVRGIWASRDDLPNFEDVRQSLDRNLWASERE